MRFARILTLSLLLALPAAGTAQTFGVDHGPYLHEVTTEGATIVFHTSLPATALVEVRRADGADSVRTLRPTAHGLRAADEQLFAVRAEGLEPGTPYIYRVRAREIRSFRPYSVTFGDSATTEWATLRTVDPAAQGGSFVVVSDMHARPALLQELLERTLYQTATGIVYAGDMMSYFERGGEEPFATFIDRSVELFARERPFVYVRGNHETRGNLARRLPAYFPTTSGHFYGAQRLGDVMLVWLDTGEDKADTHPVYAGLTDFDAYRSEQAEWLRGVVASDDFRTARYRIVVSHFPLLSSGPGAPEADWHGERDAVEKLLPVLQGKGVDVLVAGHTHAYAFHPAGSGGADFPTIVQGYHCAARIDCADGQLRLRVVNADGRTLLDLDQPAH